MTAHIDRDAGNQPVAAAAAAAPNDLFSYRQRHRTGLLVIGAALVLGLLGDLLLREGAGINFGLWVGAVALAAWGLSRQVDAPIQHRWMLGLAWLCTLGLAWRASQTLQMLAIIGGLTALAVVGLRSASGRFRDLTLVRGVTGMVEAGVFAAGGLLLPGAAVRWGSLRSEGQRRSGTLLPVLRGVAIALPLLCIFGALFASADAVFEELATSLFDWNLNLDRFFEHGFLIAWWAWICAGYLWMLLVWRQRDSSITIADPKALRIGRTEAAVALGLLNLLFLTFVVIQVGYLFGGISQLADQELAQRQVAEGFTYAEYARRGFFELVTCAALLLPVLLGFDWLVRNEEPRDQRIVRVLEGSLVGLLVLVMASALFRMSLYVDAYGLTELRLYTTAFMLWLALLFGWLCATVLRGQRGRFATGALLSAYVVLAVLFAINPDALISRVNIQRGTLDNDEVDVRYISTLSPDATPHILAALPQITDQQERCRIAGLLLLQSDGIADDDWRAWNASRASARAQIEAQRPQLEDMACAVR